MATATALMLVGCSTPGGPEKAPAEPGGDLVVAIPYAGLSDLDPAGKTASSVAPLTVDRALYDTLVTIVDGEITPSLALDWEVTGNTEFTFNLREDVTFSDGSTLDAEDVKASIERVAAAQTPFASFWKPVTSIDVTSPTSLTLTTEAPRADLLNNLSVMYIIPSEQVAATDLATNPVGSGPFLLDTFVQAESARLVPNPDYWGGAPIIDSLTFREIPELSSRVVALKTGEVDITWNLPQDQLAGLEGEEAVVLEPVESTSSYAFWFNSAAPMLTDPEVRQALWRAIDFGGMRDALLADTATLSIGVMPANVTGAKEQEPYAFDPDLAKELLDEAGFDFGSTIEIQYKDDDFAQISEVMVSDWKKIGVEAIAVKKDAATWLEDRNTGKYNVNLQTIAYPTYEPGFVLSRLYTCAAKLTNFCDTDLDSALAGIVNAADASETADAVTEAQDIIWDNAVGMFPFDLVSVWGVASRVQGFVPDPAQIPDFSKVSLIQN